MAKLDADRKNRIEEIAKALGENKASQLLHVTRGVLRRARAGREQHPLTLEALIARLDVLKLQGARP